MSTHAPIRHCEETLAGLGPLTRPRAGVEALRALTTSSPQSRSEGPTAGAPPGTRPAGAPRVP